MITKLSQGQIRRVWFKRFKQETACVIEYRDGDSWVAEAVGFARLHPRDRYNKITGKVVSLTKSLQSGHYTKPDRTRFWEAFWQQFNHLKDAQ